jgi:hypothetical protein
METTMNFQDFKAEILQNAKKAKKVLSFYSLISKTENFQDLCRIIRQNFRLFSQQNIITGELLEAVGNEELNKWDIAVNKDINGGLLYAYGDSMVEARGRAFVFAFDKAEVKAYDSTVYAFDFSKISAFGLTSVFSKGAKVHAFDTSMVRAISFSKVAAFDESEVEGFDNSEIFLFDKATASINGGAKVTRF